MKKDVLAYLKKLIELIKLFIQTYFLYVMIEKLGRLFTIISWIWDLFFFFLFFLDDNIFNLSNVFPLLILLI